MPTLSCLAAETVHFLPLFRNVTNIIGKSFMAPLRFSSNLSLALLLLVRVSPPSCLAPYTSLCLLLLPYLKFRRVFVFASIQYVFRGPIFMEQMRGYATLPNVRSTIRLEDVRSRYRTTPQSLVKRSTLHYGTVQRYSSTQYFQPKDSTHHCGRRRHDLQEIGSASLLLCCTVNYESFKAPPSG